MAANQTQSYFAQYHRFQLNPNQSLITNFHALATQEGWRPRKAKFKIEFQQFCQQEFSHHLSSVSGAGAASWQALLGELGVSQAAIPDSVKKCKQYLSTKIHVNIHDLMEHRRNGAQGTVRTFRTARALQSYTLEHGKIFPKSVAKQSSLLKILLRDIY